MKKRVSCSLLLLSLGWLVALLPASEIDVSWKAQAEIARRGPVAERIGAFASTSDPVAAIAAAMKPPADDSHKWLFTLVTTRNCSWCQQLRRDFETDAKLG